VTHPNNPSTERSRELAQRYFDEILNKGDTAAIDALLTPDFVFYIATIPGGVRGRDAYKDFLHNLRNAFPDGVFTPVEQIVEGNKAAVRWTFEGTHRGEFLGVAPTGRIITDQGIDIFQLVDGQIAEVRASEDALGLMQQLGVVPGQTA
jgi:steroid delta-isomerase-like uncharacterized protein